MTSKKWKASGPVGRALRKQFDDFKYIERGITAGDVWKNNPMFQEYKLDNFRTNFNKMKKKIQAERREEVERAEDDERADRAMDDLNTLLQGKIDTI